MGSCEVLIVGGGPAGSTAAWKLRRAGADVLVLDRERFPRLKLCAGWITPEVVRDLDMDLQAYPHRLLTFPRLRVHFGRLQVPVPCVQHSIRRFEFDAWLLERSGAPLEQHNVRRIAREGDGFVIDDAFRCRWLIGAGGTRCPDRKSTRLNSSHLVISYAVFCLKKKKKNKMCNIRGTPVKHRNKSIYVSQSSRCTDAGCVKCESDLRLS